VNWTTGGNAGIQQARKWLWEEQEDARYGSQSDSQPIWGYIDKATAAAAGSA
jgi:hypothetical protein